MKLIVFLFFLFTLVDVISMNSENTKLRSLVFIFDTTGSMNDELEQVQEGARKIFKTLSENKKKIIENYIFVPFNDPDVGPWINTNNTTEFENLINAVSVNGGDDCREMSLGGIKIGLELCSANSFVYVFTDADPKDNYLLSTVLELIQSKKSQVVFVLTGKCDSSVAPEYEAIAGSSSGQIFDLSKYDVKSVLEFIRLSLPSESDKVGLLAVDSQTNQGSENNGMYNVSVDEALKEITAALSGDSVSISFTDPSGQQVQDSSKIRNLLNLEKIKVVSIQAPTPGVWKINVTESKQYTLRVTGQSDFNFNYGFALGRIDSMNDANQRPLIGFKNNIFIAPNNGQYLSTLQSCEMIAINGTVIQTVPLIKVNGIDNLYYGTFLPNQSNFYVRVTGKTNKGTKLQRISNIAINPTETTEKPVIQGEINVSSGYHDHGSYIIFLSTLVSYFYKVYVQQ